MYSAAQIGYVVDVLGLNTVVREAESSHLRVSGAANSDLIVVTSTVESGAARQLLDRMMKAIDIADYLFIEVDEHGAEELAIFLKSVQAAHGIIFGRGPAEMIVGKEKVKPGTMLKEYGLSWVLSYALETMLPAAGNQHVAQYKLQVWSHLKLLNTNPV